MLRNPKTIHIPIRSLFLLVINFDKSCQNASIIHGHKNQSSCIKSFSIKVKLGLFVRLKIKTLHVWKYKIFINKHCGIDQIRDFDHISTSVIVHDINWVFSLGNKHKKFLWFDYSHTWVPNGWKHCMSNVSASFTIKHN